MEMSELTNQINWQVLFVMGAIDFVSSAEAN
jgi:hypothetical protein